ncbi:hypothetical protein RBQ61_02615 [Sedimentibacter sp. MB35-C1]|uniref:hypothetical protein n=1 Tax=Sedimentibacter sp. MB35-C1 TaxID=3070995 RepID=UPI0027E07AC8|nr:hypothetical protein [Sedimentibacter sp. MB35-C1]WMJ77839.1 hypothetical protein RBQ61_02615 [Sedimentibacter sp. MB35-C1]
MRNYLEKNYGNYVMLTGKIERFGVFNFDGRKNYSPLHTFPMSFLPIEAMEMKINPMISIENTTLLIIDIENEDPHLWLPLSLKFLGFNKGESIKICGQVERYKKNDGYDYCIKPETARYCSMDR